MAKWGEDEVTFRDLLEGTGGSKPGYNKIEFCRLQALRDGLEYFWVDTCCIDKSSSVELTEAINSMFLWYRHAVKCYVYLSDVSRPNDTIHSQAQLESSFRGSRWFTRGWTLLELLAPLSVEFFSRDGELLGSKDSLEAEIHKITGIPIGALQGSDLSEFTLTERLSWAEKRETTRQEDKVYSLLGICGVFMPLLYGEGRERAFRRLTEQFEKTVVSLAPSHDLSQVPRIFSPLKEYGFRVFILNPGEKGSEITGHILEHDLRVPPRYSALSYVWGDEPAIHRIDINHKEHFVRPNLLHALQRIRSRTNHARLWVDSLCINQFDKSERSLQVRRMAEIFQNAETVWIWLGEEDSVSITAMEFMPKVTHPEFRWDGVWWQIPEFKAFDQFLTRTWFRRRWVIQEAAFSASSVILSGDRALDMKHFTRAVGLVRTKLNAISRSFTTTGINIPRKGILTNFRDSPATRLLDIIQESFDRSNQAMLRRKLSLENLVDLGTFCETTDQRDTIYALLTLANDTDRPSQLGSRYSIITDYSSSLLDVFADFILHCFSHSDSLNIICRPWAPVESPSVYVIRELDLVDSTLQSSVPSWIAARDGLPFGTSPRDLAHRLHGKPLVGSSLKQVYNAHYCTKPQVHLGKIETTNTCSGSLFAKGLVIGDITQRSTRMADAIITRECIDILRLSSPDQHLDPTNLPDTVWRALCADRDSQGDPAPSIYRSAMVQLLQLNYEAENGTDYPHQVGSWSSIDIEELLETTLPGEVEVFLEVVRDVVWNRRTFRGQRKDGSGSSIVGLIPRYAQVGDQLCILYGCSVPVVLRKFLSEDRYHWQLIGEAYVYGLMDGEGISSMSSAMRKSAEIEFEIR